VEFDRKIGRFNRQRRAKRDAVLGSGQRILAAAGARGKSNIKNRLKIKQKRDKLNKTDI
jgi:hypothetical protein